MIGTWVDDSVVAELDRIAAELKVPRSKVVEMIIDQQIKQRKGKS